MNIVSSASNVNLIRNNTWSSNLTGVFHSSLALGDIDNDGDYDMVGMGCTAGGVDTCTTADKIRVYVNNGTTFNENLTWESNTTNLGYGSLALGDIDNDGDLDLVALGDIGGGTGDVKIYLNNGTTFNNDLTWEENLSSVDVYAGSLALGDIDNDGDLDLGLVGTSPSGNNGIYINNGTSFVKDASWLTSLPLVGHGLGMGTLTFGDLDNDLDLDLVFAGSYSTNFYTNVYINNGTSLVDNSSWKGDFTATFGWPSLTLGDYDNDKDLDLAVIGTKAGDHHKIYNNTGSSFSFNQERGGAYDGSIAFGDFDNDGDLDLALIGKESGSGRIYTNNKTIFETDIFEQQDMDDDAWYQGGLVWGDIDGDYNIDLIINGKKGDDSLNFTVYISNASSTKNNTLPKSPDTFTSSYSNGILNLTWNNGSDAETNSTGLYYNLMVGNETANHTIVSGVYGGSSNPTAGYFGNMMQRKSILLNVELDANETYYWYVQTIDTGLAKSNWSAQQSFNTSLDTTKPSITIKDPSPSSELHTTNPYFIFNATVIDNNVRNVTLYANWTGSMIINETNNSEINGTYTFEKNLTDYNDGMYSWYITANDTSNNSQTSGIRSFYLDREYPLVYLESPANVSSWTSSSTVTFSYNVTDTDIANCSLIINNIVDQTVTPITEGTTQTFTKSLSNGDYIWSVNCTDYVNYINLSETRNLTVSYTAPDRGDRGGPSGSGAVTTKAPEIKEFNIDFFEMEIGNSERIEAKQGDIKTFSFNSQTTHKITLLELTTTSIKLIIESEPISLVLNINEIKQIDINKDNINDFEIKLISIAGTKTKLLFTKLEGADIVGQEEIEEAVRKEALFDVKINILDKFKEVFAGEEVTAEIEVFNVNKIGQVDVVVDYYLTSKEDNLTKLAEGFDTLAVEAVTSFVRNLIVPEDLKSGTYFFNVDITYKNFVTSGRAEFKVKSKVVSFLQSRFKEIVIIGIVLIAIAIFIYLWRIKRKEEKDIGMLKRQIKKLKNKKRRKGKRKRIRRK